ncbi:MAG: tol-pal system YbgF family protein [Sandaracinaceae bacterium]
MQRRFEELHAALAEHIEQREALMLVLWHWTPSAIAFAHKYLEAMEQATRRDIFLVFHHEFVDGAGYVDAMMSTCEVDIEVANRVLADGAGGEGTFPWEGLPTACFDTARRPKDRVRALVEHIRRYYPEARHRIVFGLLPPSIEDHDAYAALVSELVAWDGYEPWMAGVRMVALDSRGAPRLVPQLADREAFGVRVLPVDFRSEAMQAALDQTASDPDAPKEDRVKALIQLAALDHAYNRIPESIAKYRVAYHYYTREKNDVMRGLCLLGQGWALERANQVVDARERFRQALEIGIANESGQLMLNALMSLGGLELRADQWSEGATYYDTAAGVAKHLNNPFSCSDALLYGGVCRVALNQTKKAREGWEVGVTIAGQGQSWSQQIRLLEHLIEIERREGLDEERRAHERQLEVARREELVQNHEIDQAKRAVEAAGGLN